jgi:hypothetical protein
MIRTIKRFFLLIALIGAAYAGFRWGPAVFPRVEEALGIARQGPAPGGETAPTAELADSTLDRFERFRDGAGADRLALSGRELSAVLRFSLPGIVPPGVTEPTVTLKDGQMYLSARVAVAAFPNLPKLDDVLGILPDTVQVELRGSLVPHDQRNLALLVDRISAARIPIPTRLVADVLEGFGRESRAGLGPDALPVPLPDGLSSVHIQRDSLVLIAARDN